MPNQVLPGDPAHLRVLDALRLRLSAVNNTLAQTRGQVESGDPLPPWPALQQSLHLSTSALTDLAATLATNHDILASFHAYPLPTYPSTAPEGVPMAENVRLQLMRKKLEPNAEKLIEAGAKYMDERHEKESVDTDDMKELWDWAADLVPSIIMKQAWNADYTKAELDQGYKTVRTGLKRKLNHDRAEGEEDEDEDGSESEDEGDDDDIMRIDEDGATASHKQQQTNGKNRASPAVTIEETLRYMQRGTRTAGSGVAR